MYWFQVVEMTLKTGIIFLVCNITHVSGFQNIVILMKYLWFKLKNDLLD